MNAETLRQIESATAILRAGGVVALPSETVYGLAARADDARAVADIFALKGRPSHNPLIVHMKDLDMARRYVEFDARALRLAEAFWPGALTLVLPQKTPDEGFAPIATNVSAGLSTLAVRLPAHPVFHEVIARLDVPIAAPSANLSGRLSPTQAAHVARDFGERLGMIIDGGATEYGLESSVVLVDKTGVTLLRHGAIEVGLLEAALGEKFQDQLLAEEPLSPGQLLKHYAPDHVLMLNQTPDDLQPGDLWIGFGDGGEFDLSPTGDLREAARRLFDILSQADAKAPQHARILVAPIPMRGIGVAINDRLHRAAHAHESETKK